MQETEVFFVEIPKEHFLSNTFRKEFPDFTNDIPLPFLPLVASEMQEDCSCHDHTRAHGDTHEGCQDAHCSCHDRGDGQNHDHTHESHRAELTAEMIVAGLMSVFAFHRNHPHFEYYKELFLALKPKAKHDLISLAVFNLSNFEFEESLLLLKALEGLYPKDPVVLVNLAQIYEKRALFYERSDLIDDARQQEHFAETYYSEAILAEPPLPQTFFSAAFFYLSQKNYAKARTLFNTYINLETGKSEEISFKKKKVLAIIESINAQELDDLAYRDAIAFIKNDEDEKALSRIRDFLDEHPKSWNGWFVLGWALRKLERFDDAEKAFLKALENGQAQESIEIENAHSDICNELSLCYVAKKDYDSAKKWLLSAFEHDTENIKIISNLGMVSYYEGDFETARGFFNTVLTLSADDATAKAMLARLN